jgi:hypothetical protein
MIDRSIDFQALKPFATETQAVYLDLLTKHDGKLSAAAREAGRHRRVVERAVEAASRRAAVQGYSPQHDMTNPAPAPFVVKGVSTYYDANGRPQAQWVKTRLDDQLWKEAIRNELGSLIETLPVFKSREAPLDYQTDIIPWIQIGDAHLGMLAHEAECGESFDLKICVADLVSSFGQLIDELPNCERLVINDVGDFTHYENMRGETEASGHKLDYDGRFPKMIRAYRQVMQWIVEKALTKAQHVDVIVNQGNHSRTNDIWMAELLRAVYGPSGRVHVLNNDSVFIAYRMGNTLVMTHHSDQCKPERLCDVMTTDFRKDYGETEFHYVDIGHIHHRMVMKEHPGISVESWNQLAAKDKWAHDGGYRSRRSISVVLRSKTYGEVGRRLLPIEEVRARMGLGPIRDKAAYAV